MSARCDTFAPVNSMAEAFGHAATQAPQPMHSAASMANSAFSFGTRMALASTALPARADGKNRAYGSGTAEIARAVQRIDGHQIGSIRRGKRLRERSLLADQARAEPALTQSRDQDVVRDAVELADPIAALVEPALGALRAFGGATGDVLVNGHASIGDLLDELSQAVHPMMNAQHAVP